MSRSSLPVSCRAVLTGLSRAALCAARVKIDNVGMPKVIDSLSTKAMIQGMTNPTTLISSLIFLLDNIVSFPSEQPR